MCAVRPYYFVRVHTETTFFLGTVAALAAAMVAIFAALSRALLFVRGTMVGGAGVVLGGRGGGVGAVRECSTPRPLKELGGAPDKEARGAAGRLGA